jgi:hypothetical protein
MTWRFPEWLFLGLAQLPDKTMTTTPQNTARQISKRESRHPTSDDGSAPWGEGVGDMRDDEGYIILHNGVRRTFRDKRETPFEAARYAKSKAKGELIEIVDCSTEAKLIM